MDGIQPPTYSIVAHFREQDIKEEQQKKDNAKNHKCQGCMWGKWLNDELVVCFWNECVKEKKAIK